MTYTSDAERRSTTMHVHYRSRLVALGLLRDTEGIVKSSAANPSLQLTDLGYFCFKESTAQWISRLVPVSTARLTACLNSPQDLRRRVLDAIER